MPASPKAASLELPTTISARGVRCAPAILESLTQAECRMRSLVLLDLKAAVQFDIPTSGRSPLELNGQITSRISSGPYYAYTVGLIPMPQLELATLARAIERLAHPKVETRNETARFASAATELPPRGSAPPTLFSVFYRSDGRGPRVARATRVASSGMVMTCKDVFRQGECIEVRFALPGDATYREVTLRAKIVCSQSAGIDTYDYGLAFLNIDPAAREQIARYERKLSP